METRDRIKRSFQRNSRALQLQPSIGRGTAVTRVSLEDGLRCVVEEGDWRLVVDMPSSSGGADAGPNPGVLGRGALGSCLAMSYAKWGAALDVPIDEVTVEVQADYDAAGEYGVADVPAGYSQVRYIVTIASDAPEEEILRVLDIADERACYHDVLRRPVELRREVHIRAPRPQLKR